MRPTTMQRYTPIQAAHKTGQHLQLENTLAQMTVLAYQEIIVGVDSKIQTQTVMVKASQKAEVVFSRLNGIKKLVY